MGDWQRDAKRAAAYYAVDHFVQSGMRLGLGTGSTVAFVLDRLAQRLQDGTLTDIAGIPTSEATTQRARDLGIPLLSFDDVQTLDLCIDGADEVDPSLNLIKGLGGALVREKIVASAARAMVVVVDESKLVPRLGGRAPLPVEVLTFGWQLHAEWFRTLGIESVLRRTADGAPFVSDNGNYIYDCQFPDGIDDPLRVEAVINNRPGVVENGLFLGYATQVVIGMENGSVTVRQVAEER